MAQLVGRLPSAWVMIPESWNQVPHRAPCSVGSLLLSLPLPLSRLVLACLFACARSLWQIDKIFQKKKKIVQIVQKLPTRVFLNAS